MLSLVGQRPKTVLSWSILLINKQRFDRANPFEFEFYVDNVSRPLPRLVLNLDARSVFF